MPRLLIIDESLNKHLARELKARGRDSDTHASLGFTEFKDPAVIQVLAALDHGNWILVTGDDYMPWDHEEELRAIGATVATVDGEWERILAARSLAMTQEEFKRESVHRWAHIMAEQSQGSWRRYSPFASKLWTVRKKFERLRPRVDETDSTEDGSSRRDSGVPPHE